MKKLLLILCVITLALPNLKAELFDNLLFGVKGGVNLASMSFSQEPYSIYKQETFMRPLFSVFAECDLVSNLSLRPELMFIGRGVKINDNPENYFTDNIEYEFAPNYFDFRLPFIWNFRTTNVTPYLLVSPNFGFVVGGYTTREGGFEDNEMNTGYINDFDFGVSFGAGVKFPIRTGNFKFYVGVEGQYNLGLINNKPVKDYGTRSNRGIELALTLSIPLCSDDNNRNKYSRRNDNIIRNSGDTVVIVRYDTIKIYQKDTLIMRKPEILVDHNKDCYEIREIIAYADNDFNIRAKEICLFDIVYDNNRASVDAASRKQLDEIVALLKKIPNMQMQINGHADNRGTKEVNDKISKERAKGVYDYIVSKGINKNRLKYEGFGFDRPIATNETEEGRRQNRRVEFEITAY